MTERRATYLIQDPYDDDALTFIRTIFTYFGLRPVCFYTDPKERFYGEQEHPSLVGNYVEASYDLVLDEIPAFCDELRQRYDIRGVIPYREDTLEVAARLCRHLDIGWNPPEVIARFRDKHALKSHLREQEPSVRVPRCRLVKSPDDLWSQPLPPRFVLKPNDGFGNQQVGIFEASDEAAIAGHLTASPHVTWILEEYIGGTEFHVDGQVRPDGEVTVLAVMEYLRTAVNGSQTVYVGEAQCHTNHPCFRPLVDYAKRVLAATGLRRCPFHLEAKVDGQGPCLIDLGARLLSEGGGHTLSRLHPERPDVYAVAAHDYLGGSDFARQPVDWAHYDKEATVVVYGISTTEGIIQELQGLSELEALPEFVCWVTKPRIGDPLVPTKSLRDAPYIVELRHRGDHEASIQLIHKVHSTVLWNQTDAPSTRLKAWTTHALRRGKPKLHWIAHNLARAVDESRTT